MMIYPNKKMKKLFSLAIIWFTLLSFSYAAWTVLVKSPICNKKYPWTLMRISDRKCVCATWFPLRWSKNNRCSLVQKIVAPSVPSITIQRIPIILFSGAVFQFQIIWSGVTNSWNAQNTTWSQTWVTVLDKVTTTWTMWIINTWLLLPDLQFISIDTWANVKKITIKNIGDSDYTYDPKWWTLILYCVGEDNRTVVHTRLPFSWPLYDQSVITIKPWDNLTFESSPTVINLFPQNQNQQFACIIWAPIDYYITQDWDRLAYDWQYQTMNNRAQQYFGYSIKRFDYGTSFVFWDTKTYCDKGQYTNTTTCKWEKNNTILESNYTNNVRTWKLFN